MTGNLRGLKGVELEIRGNRRIEACDGKIPKFHEQRTDF